MSQLTSKEADIAAREKIIKEISSNFFVEAGAGSGKTTILVKRMVAMIESGIDVSQICAITFTKAAAGEFYARFQKKLIERSTASAETADKDLAVPTEETKKRCLDALGSIDLCFMGTIDSFCNMILSEHPAKAGIPSNASVLSAEDIGAVYKKEYSQIQRGHYGNDLKMLCNRFRLYHRDPDKVFSSVIGIMMDTRNCKHILPAPKDGTVDEIYKAEKSLALKVFRHLLDNSHLAYDKNKTSADAWETLKTKERLLFDAWEHNIPDIVRTLNSLLSLRLIPETDITEFDADGQSYFEIHESRNKPAWYEFSETGLPELIKKLKDLQYAVTMNFLTNAAGSIAKNLRKNGYLTYFDYLVYLRDMLRDDAASGGALIRHIAQRHRYFLIDEFQDTNPMQAEIFFYLSAQNPVADWRKCVPEKGSLFIVGDPKQSIYRFRYADVSSFLRVKEMFKNDVGEVLYLTQNFRSTYKLRSWFNDTFQALLPQNTDIQSRFELIPLENPPKDDTFTGVYSYRVSGARGASPSEKDPETTAKIIRQLVENPAYMIYEEGKTRTVTYKDIMLITPRKSKLSDYMQVFTEYDIPFKVEGSVSFDESPGLITVSEIFGALASPTDAAAVSCALTGARFKVSANKIHDLKNQGLALNLFTKNEMLTDTDPVAAAMNELKILANAARTLSASALFVAIVNRLEIFRYVSTHNLSYIYFALELLRAAEANGKFATLGQAALFLESLIQNESDAERTLSLTRNENRVHLANLHKVKGLEAPIVILADPTPMTRKPGIRVTQTDAEPDCHIFEVSDGLLPILSYSGYTKEKDAEESCLDAERIRLLYVAATRARRVLLIADETKSDGSSNDTNLWKVFVDRAEGDFFSSLPQGQQKPMAKKQQVSADKLYEKGKEENLLSKTSSYAESYEIRRPSQIKLKGKSASEDNFEDEASTEIRTGTIRQNAALVGTMVHRLMEVLVSTRKEIDIPLLITEIVTEYESDTPDCRTMLKTVAETILSGGFEQKGNAPKDILKTLLSADEVYCEMPFCRKMTESGKTVIWHGIMDVIYRTGDAWFIVDYKTNAEATGLDTKYQEQLSAYVDAFSELTGQKAQAMIYHIDV